MKSGLRRGVAVVLGMVILSTQAVVLPVRAADISRTMTLEQAKTLAFAASEDYRKLSGSIALKLAEYTEAVKSIWAKKLDMATFRWTPLLSFKFPEQPGLAEAYEWQYKPLQIQSEIRSLRHELSDVRYKLAEEVSNLYAEVYTAQEKIVFNSQRLSDMEQTIARNSARVMTGEAKSEDVEKMKKTALKITGDLSLQERAYESSTKELSDYLKINVSLGYKFMNPFVTAEIDRGLLPALTEYTLSQDQGLYETKLNTGLGKMSLDLNDSLMTRKYGSKMNMIRPYINQAKKGEEVDAEGFKASYDSFLERIDAPWQGAFWILFIKIEKEWLKGEKAGIRYIQDEPYAMYTAALEYQELLVEEEKAEKALRKRVSSDFENLVSAGNAYKAMAENQKQAEADARRNLALNQAGRLSYEELSISQESAQESRIDTLDALSSYSELLYAYDRLTCGAITTYLRDGNLDSLQVSGGSSYAAETGDDSPGYYIESRIEDQMFVFGVTLPEDGGLDADSYELWADGTRIGEQKDVTETISHLTLTMEQIDRASVRFYKGEQQVGEYTFDPTVTEGKFRKEDAE